MIWKYSVFTELFVPFRWVLSVGWAFPRSGISAGSAAVTESVAAAILVRVS